MILLTRGASLGDLAAMRDSSGLGEKYATFAWAAGNIARTRTFSASRGDGLCVACGGYFDHGDGWMEVWFACRPEAACEMVGIVRAAHWTIRSIAESERVGIFARVRHGWRPGRRIARALSMRHVRDFEGWEIWEF